MALCRDHRRANRSLLFWDQQGATTARSLRPPWPTCTAATSRRCRGTSPSSTGTRTASSTLPRHTKARTVPSLHVLCYPRHGPVNYVILHVMTILIASGFRAIGAGVPLAAAGAAFINGLLGPKTIPVYVVLHSLLLFFIYSRRSAFFLSQPCWPDHRYLQLWPSVL
jgi:hypothetical protein